MLNILKGLSKLSTEEYTFPTSVELAEKQRAEELLELQDDQEGTTAESARESINPKNPIDYARLQADMIMENARLQAEEILKNARTEAEESIEVFREEGRAAGFRVGYEEGLVAVQEEAKAAREEQALQLQGEIKRFLESVSRERETMMEEAVGEIKDLALAIAEKVVRISLKSSGEVVARMVSGAIEKMKRREWVHIYISGCDSKTMAQITTSLSPALAALSDHVKIVPMATEDENDTCIIEMPDEIIDASASTQLSSIKDLLEDAPLMD